MTDASPRAGTLHLQLLGPVALRLDGDAASTSIVTQPRPLAVCIYLALARPRGLQARDVIASLLWPEHDADRSRRALRNALHALRHALGTDRIISAGDQLVGLASDVVCDVHDLERGRWPREPDVPLPQPLQGFHVPQAPGFDQWLSAERRRLTGLLERHAAAPSAGTATVSSPIMRPGSASTMTARGHYLFLRAAHDGSAEELARAKAWFDRALEADPSFAPAVAGLSNYFAVAARRGLLTPFDDAWAQCIAHSHRALAMDPHLAAPHVHLGAQALYLDDAWDRAGDEFATAVRVEPDDAMAHRFLGVWLGLAGRDAEAHQEMEAAAALEPDIPQVLTSLAAARLTIGDAAGAEAALRSVLELAPRHRAAAVRLVRLLEDTDRLADAATERQRLADGSAERFSMALRDGGSAAYRATLAEQVASDAEALEHRLRSRTTASINERFDPPELRLIEAYLRLGDARRAREWRLRAIGQRPALARWIDAVARGVRAVR